MPQRKKIRSLKDLCIDNVTENIVIHGDMFGKHRGGGNDRIYASYKTLQFLFSDDLLEKFLLMLAEESVHENFRELQDFMFFQRPCDSEQIQGKDYWPCLELLFNEYTSTILPPPPVIEKYVMFCESVASFVTSQCTNLNRINIPFCGLIRDELHTISRIQNLTEVELGKFGSEETLTKILETCHLIKDLSAHATATDLLFLCLCKHHSHQSEFIFCPENGKCSNAGKRLEQLHVTLHRTTTNGAGIACALQHAPRLKSFYQLPPEWPVFSREILLPDVLKGIMTLQNAAIHEEKANINLKLAAFYFYKNLKPQEMHSVMISCPNLETIQVDLSVVNPQFFTLGSFENLKELYFYNATSQSLSSTELMEMMSRKGKQIQTLGFQYSREFIDLSCIHNILHSCVNLKSLSLDCIRILDRNYTDLTNMPSCIAKLEYIFIKLQQCNYRMTSSYYNYFCEFLCCAETIRRLKMGVIYAEHIFLSALEKNHFQFLEELGFLTGYQPYHMYMKLLDAKNNLRKLQFCNRQPSPIVARCKQFIRNNNYDVEFVDREKL